MLNLPLHQRQRMTECLVADDLDEVLRMLDLPQDPGVVRTVRETLDDPLDDPRVLTLKLSPWLAYAVYHEAPRVTAWLLASGEDPNRRLDRTSDLSNQEETPLHLAAARARPDLVDLLLQHGADPSITSRHPIRLDDIPLMYAINAWVDHDVQPLANRMDQRDGLHDTLAVLRRLIPVSPIDRSPIEGPAHLQRTVQGLPIKANLSMTPLARAVRIGYAPAVHALLEQGLDPVCADGRALWQYALEANAGLVLATLTHLKKGPPPGWTDAAGNSALHLAVMGPAPEGQTALFRPSPVTLGGLIDGETTLGKNHAGHTALDLLRALPGDHSTALAVLSQLEARDLKNTLGPTEGTLSPSRPVRRL